jgi:protein-L-isoaspartate(D-aspartate) O-methyltransferase
MTLPITAAPQEPDPHREDRERMVEHQLRRRGIRDPRVLQAMATVPRHEFVPPGLRWAAYEDRPLPIGFGQTISQPLMVADMLQAARLRPEDRALDVGAGSGYQTALLASLCREVVAIELIPDLADRARATLRRLGVHNATVITGDGSAGWPDGAPYDAILVAAAAREIPSALKEQLAVGGRLLIPIGPPHSQMLTLVERRPEGLRTTRLEPCSFVPLVGPHEPR